MKKKFCQVGNHYVDKLFHSATKECLSSCFLHVPRTPIKPKVGDTIGTMQIKSITKSDNGLYTAKISPSKPKKQKPIAKVSQKQLDRLKAYKKVRDKYMDAHPYCEARLEYCQVKSTEVHHKAGKVGKLLSDVRYFLAVCRTCHDRIERHPEMAKELGFSLNRLDK